MKSNKTRRYTHRYARDLLPLNVDEPKGYDCLFLSDLLYFDSSHDALVSSITKLLKRDFRSRVWVCAGKYTKPKVCTSFLRLAESAGLVWEEGEEDNVWRGGMAVGGMSLETLGERKGVCRWWRGQWKS